MFKALKFFIVILTLSMICNILAYKVLAAATDESMPNEMTIEDEYFIRFMEAIKDRDTDSMHELLMGKEKALSQEAINEIYDYWNGREMTSYKKIGEEKRPENEKKQQSSGMK